MAKRALRSFVVGAGRIVHKGDLFQYDARTVHHDGVKVTLGFHLPDHFYETVPDPAPQPGPEPDALDAVETATEVLNRDPEVTNRTPRPRKRRASEGATA